MKLMRAIARPGLVTELSEVPGIRSDATGVAAT